MEMPQLQKQIKKKEREKKQLASELCSFSPKHLTSIHNLETDYSHVFQNGPQTYTKIKVCSEDSSKHTSEFTVKQKSI